LVQPAKTMRCNDDTGATFQHRRLADRSVYKTTTLDNIVIFATLCIEMVNNSLRCHENNMKYL